MTAAVRGVKGGEENLRRLTDYISGLQSAGRGVPWRGNGPNLSMIATACGFDRGVFYSNTAAKALIDDAVIRFGRDSKPHTGVGNGSPTPATVDDTKEVRGKRAAAMESEILLLRAENAQLRAENARFSALQRVMAETGRMP